ncbi:MAG: ABC transporter permease, partial [Thermodesulfovibrionales bacterium]
MNVRRRIGKVLSVSVKEAREIWRTRLFLVLAFAVPFIMFIVFGYGISLDIENMPFGYVDNDKTQASALLVDKFRNRYFDLSRELSGTAEAETLLSKGSLRAVLVIPPDFSRSIYRGDATVLQFLIDGGYPYRAITVKGYAEAIVAKFNMEIARERLESSGMQWRTFRPIAVETRYLFNESLKSSNALIPGLLAIILLMNPAVLTALAITREKEFGTIYNIYASPMKKWEFLAGKIIPYLIISAINFAV